MSQIHSGSRTVRVRIDNECLVSNHVRTVTERDDLIDPIVRYLPRLGGGADRRLAPLGGKDHERLTHVMGNVEVTITARERDVEIIVCERRSPQRAYAA